jgi:hypothetical protein
VFVGEGPELFDDFAFCLPGLPGLPGLERMSVASEIKASDRPAIRTNILGATIA